MAVNGKAASDSDSRLFPHSDDISDLASDKEAELNPLNRIPPELRNGIFAFALVEDRPIEVTDCWPGLTGTCKQFREEALAIYFGNNTFLARIIDLEDAPLIAWLCKFDGIADRHKTLISEFQVLNEGQPTESRPGPPPKVPACFPNFEFWDNIIAHLKGSGLAATQVKWSSPLLTRIEANTWRDLRPFPFPAQPAIEAALHSHILPWLLKRHDFYDDETPPIDVQQRIKDKYGNLAVAWIVQQRHRSQGCHRSTLDNKEAWWKKPLEEDPEWKERIRKYQEIRQREKERKAAAECLLQWREEERVRLEAAQALLTHDSYMRTRVSPETRSLPR